MPPLNVERERGGSQPGIPARAPDSCKNTEPGNFKGPALGLPRTHRLGKATAQVGPQLPTVKSFWGLASVCPCGSDFGFILHYICICSVFCSDWVQPTGKFHSRFKKVESFLSPRPVCLSCCCLTSIRQVFSQALAH